jgi:Ca2+-binding EF-hand superfamily protein
MTTINKTWAMVGAGTLMVAVGAVAVALAADWGGGKVPRASAAQGGSSALRMVQYDGDKDGRVTRAEINTGIAAQFGAADTNSDGKLDAAEILRYNDKRKADRRARYEAWKAKAAALGRDPGRPPSDRDTVDNLRAADWNLDGFITGDEFGGKTRALAMRADRNGDGVIDAEELKRRGGRAQAKKN